MNKLKHTAILLLAIVSALLFSSCSKRVEVPPAHVGFVKTGAGIESEIHQPSSFRLPMSMAVKNQLILIETSDFAKSEKLELYMPKDKLNFLFDIRGTYNVSPSKAYDVIRKVTANKTEDSDIMEVSCDKVYDIYVRQVIRTKVRSIVANYSILEVVSNLDAVSDRLYEEVAGELKNSPVNLLRLGIASAQPPEVIVNAQIASKEREVAIQTAEADKLVRIKIAEGALAIARKQQEIDLVEAETQVLVEQKLSESVNRAFVTQRSLKILEKLATSDNKVFILPQEALSNPSVMIGINQQALAK